METEGEKGEHGKRRKSKIGWELQVLDPAVGQCRDLVLSFPTCQKELKCPFCFVSSGRSMCSRIFKFF